VNSIDEINKRYTRNDIVKLGLIFPDEAKKRFNVNEGVVTIETADAIVKAQNNAISLVNEFKSATPSSIIELGRAERRRLSLLLNK
jgi:hypothetical protein